jgi:hypothetical protein
VLTGDISKLTGHESYKTTVPTSKHNRYKKTLKKDTSGKYVDSSEAIREVHIYVSEYKMLTDNRLAISSDAIMKIETYDPAVAQTVASHIFVGTVIAAGVVLAAVIISDPGDFFGSSSSSSSSGGCSCPSIKAYNGY